MALALVFAVVAVEEEEDEVPPPALGTGCPASLANLEVRVFGSVIGTVVTKLQHKYFFTAEMCLNTTNALDWT
jgi:hypothetical protein